MPELSEAKGQLRKQGIISTLVKKPKPLFSRSKKITPADIALLTRQLATMMKAGVPLVQAFDIVADGFENEMMKGLIFQIRDDVAAGGFANALRKAPVTSTISSAAWWIPEKLPVLWRPCWIEWPPTRRKPSSSRQKIKP